MYGKPLSNYPSGVWSFCQILVIFFNKNGTRRFFSGNPQRINPFVQDKLIDLPSRGILKVSTLFILEFTAMSQPVELTLEQQFSIRSFEAQVRQMSREQAQDFLVELYEQMMMRENMYRHFLKQQWGLEPGGPQLP
jgi:hypothetical protein